MHLSHPVKCDQAIGKTTDILIHLVQKQSQTKSCAYDFNQSSWLIFEFQTIINTRDFHF